MTEQKDDDGINGYGFYDGFFNYFFPETSLTIQVTSMIILMGFLKDIKKLIKQEITVKNFPLIHLGVYFVTSMFMFMFMFGNGGAEKNAKGDELTEAGTLCLMGKVGYYICLLWGSFCAFYYFPNIKTRIVAVVCFILGSFIVLVVIALVLKIPFINKLLIIIVYTAYNLVPAIDIKKAFENNNKNYLNIISLLGTLFLNGSITISYFKSMRAFGFQFIGLFVVINSLVVMALVVYYFYLYFRFGEKPLKEETTKEDNTTDKESKEDLANDKLNEDKEKKDDDKKDDDYKPPTIGINESETIKEEDKIDEEGRVY